MLDEQDGNFFLIPYTNNQVIKLFGFPGIHSCGRFIQKQDRWLRCHGACDLQTSLCAIGKIFGVFIDELFQADFFKYPVTVFDNFLFFSYRGWISEDGAGYTGRHTAMTADHDVFQYGHILKKTDVLKCTGHTLLGDMVGFHTLDKLFFSPGWDDGNIPFCGWIDTGDAVKEGGLSGTIGANQRHDFPLPDSQVDVVEGSETAKVFGQVCYFENRFHILKQSVACPLSL